MHKQDCKMSFGRKDPSCPRCQALLNGAKPVQGWGKTRKEKQQEYSRWLSALKAHDCTKSKCGPVCTAFDW